ERNIQSHITLSMSRRQNAIATRVRQYNKMCRRMAWLISNGNALRGAIAPHKIKVEGLYKLNINNDVWQNVSLDNIEEGDVPPWLGDDRVQEGIQ
ncbi:hypothetical protein BXZ70DRAFT_869949, partial [Cristinia sonorae]